MPERPDFTTSRAFDAKGTTIILRFDWWGGEYIEVRSTRPHRTGGELINVWGASGKPTIARTQEALERRARDWIDEYGAEALAHDVIENWRF